MVLGQTHPRQLSQVGLGHMACVATSDVEASILAFGFEAFARLVCCLPPTTRCPITKITSWSMSSISNTTQYSRVWTRTLPRFIRHRQGGHHAWHAFAHHVLCLFHRDGAVVS